MMQTVLEISDLSFSYGGTAQPVLERISFSIKTGEIIAVLGGSGCGKSTLLNLIAGLLKPQIGSININDSTQSGRIGYIQQEDALLPWRTVKANLALATELASVPKLVLEQRIKDYLVTFNLDESALEKFPSQLSGGMRQRISIIQSLTFDPQMLLLDEPFSALDFYTKLRLETEFYNLIKNSDKAAILVTHDIEEAIAMSDRVIILGKGGILSDVKMSFGSGTRDPETVRGTSQFGDYYRIIWSQLKAVMSA